MSDVGITKISLGDIKMNEARINLCLRKANDACHAMIFAIGLAYGICGDGHLAGLFIFFIVFMCLSFILYQFLEAHIHNKKIEELTRLWLEQNGT